jgi:hypothetical protein
MKKIHTAKLLASVLACALAVCLYSPALAGPIATDVHVTIYGSDGDTWWEISPLAELDADGNFVLRPDDCDYTDFCTRDIVVSGNADPVISSSFNVTNNTLVTQDYTFIFTLPIVPQTPVTITGGSTGITITDNNGNGAALGAHTNGRPTYYSQIDAVDFTSLSLLPLVEPNPFESETKSAAFGTPIPSLPGPAALSTIGIRYDFSLTAGDSAGVTGVFVVQVPSEPIPEPGSITLAGFAALLLAAVARKRFA